MARAKDITRDPSQNQLCTTCTRTAETISSRIISWPRTSEDLNLDDYWKPKGAVGKPLPSNVIMHVLWARHILNSATSCQLYAMIRDVIVVGFYFDGHMRSRFCGYLVEKLPCDLILVRARNHELFLSPNYADCPIYLRLSMYPTREAFKPRVLEHIDVLVAQETSTGDSSVIEGYISAQAHLGMPTNPY
jgi:hypothetical protein